MDHLSVHFKQMVEELETVELVEETTEVETEEVKTEEEETDEVEETT